MLALRNLWVCKYSEFDASVTSADHLNSEHAHASVLLRIRIGYEFQDMSDEDGLADHMQGCRCLQENVEF